MNLFLNLKTTDMFFVFNVILSSGDDLILSNNLL